MTAPGADTDPLRPAGAAPPAPGSSVGAPGPPAGTPSAWPAPPAGAPAGAPWTPPPYPPGPPPAPPRPPAPDAVVRSALIIGVAAAVLLPGEQFGIGVPLLGLVAAAVLAPFAPAAFPRDAGRLWRVGYLGLALLLLAAAAIRDADWVVELNLLAAAGLASLALVPWRSWAGVLPGLLGVGLSAPRAAGWLGRGLRGRAARTRLREAVPAIRGTALTALLLAVFLPLLASADAAFADLLNRVTPDIPSPGGLTGRLFVFAAGSVLAASAASILLHPRVEPQLSPPRRVLSRAVEWLPPLGSLTTLLAVFVGLQAQVLFGGRELVQRTGLTYAEYTRSGFWQLLIVTALVLAVVAAAARWTSLGQPVRWLLGGICLLALLIDASALSRLSLYVWEYGLTRARVIVALTCLWLAVVLLAVLVAGIRRRGGWLPPTVITSAAIALVLLTAYNPDARIARTALDQGPKADLLYLSTLSADAVAVLDELPPYKRGCVLAPIADRLQDGGGWPSANLSRARAGGLLGEGPAYDASCGLRY